ncbi:GlsB/YeaQ/YmgE family stress response membrane protein [Nocardioides sp. Soil805]|uniref:GlsB/YeaQ/YmgE family stress response membrane protein n=1 Tax=Nocardioides sp. Soil805 TaxID=1736416 RepID=UPI000702A944|nr:GlsB/YeaQ/YmgE family stress response membrane protein [Nocardioides sp. Soil805]KRF34298.1 hypothetical protein ASG94_16420 [Nocardioides sp. Soil805]
MLILAVLAFGFLVGGLAQMLLGRSMREVNWPRALGLGLLGSLVGGTVLSLLFGEGFELRPAGIIGSVLGAVLLTALVERGADRSR